MKKLVIGAVALAAAFVANAGAVIWSCDGICDATTGEGDVDGYAVYFLMDSGTGYSGTKVAQAAALTAIAAGNLSFLDSAVIGDAGGAAITEWGAAGDTNAGTGAFADDTTDVHGYLVVLNASTAADATKAYVTDVKDFELVTGGGSVEFGSLTATATPSNWTAVAPEPTSGLLLLIGMAGLALRRRRA